MPMSDVMDPIESLSRFERFLLRVLEHRGPRAFVWVVTLLSILMSQIVTCVTMLLTDAPTEDFVIGVAIAFVVPLVMASTTAAVLARVLSSLRSATDQLHHLSRTDSLTGLLNRRAFFTDVEAMLAPASSAVLVVAMVDIDNFKQFNDEHGHAPGDRLLCALAGNLCAAVGDGVVSRLGGDEFAVALLVADASVAAEVAARLSAAGDLRAVDHEQVASVGVFIGATSTPLDEALAEADKALYEGKRDRRRGVPDDDLCEAVLTAGPADEVRHSR
jgi:diguanylate cyclase (GGDEF)-like protein